MNELIYKIEIYSQMQLTHLQLPKGKGVGDKLEVWDQHIHTTVYKIDDQDLLYSTGNYIQYLVICNGKNLNDNLYIYMYN